MRTDCNRDDAPATRARRGPTTLSKTRQGGSAKLSPGRRRKPTAYDWVVPNGFRSRIIAAFRFVHAADVHLDSPLRSLALRKPELWDLIGNATRRAFVAIVDLCLEERVDALLLAGDLYDGEQTSMKTARFLAEQVRRLHEAGIHVFIIRGNHDALSRITKELIFPDSVKIFGGRADAIDIRREPGEFAVSVHGLSFAQPHAPESLLGKFRPPLEDAVNIGLMHTSLAGSDGHDLYAPCAVAELQGSGFRYWALGHIHKRSIVEGACTVVMPGMPQGRDINEAGAKSVSLVTVADDRSITIEERLTSLAQFERVWVDTTGLDDWRDLVVAAASAMEQARARVPSRHLVARLKLTGVTPLAWRIRRDLDVLAAEIEDRASVIGDCWIEKLELDCRAPGSTPSAVPDDPIVELRRLIADDIMRSEAYQREVAEIADELRSQLPPECRGILGSDEATSRTILAVLEREGAEDVLARLHPGSETGRG